MVVFTALDYFWLITYLLLMALSGILFYRLGSKSESDFFLAGRGLPWWLPAMSVFATHTATDSPMWISGVVYKFGLVGIWYTFFAAWCAVSAFASTRIFRRSLAYSQAEWLSQRFGGLGAELLRGWLAGWQVFLQMLIMGWVGIAMGNVCRYAFGWQPWQGVVLFSSIAAIYALTSGYWGVVVADFQQGVIAFFAIVIASVWGVAVAGGPTGIASKLAALGQSERIDPFAFTGLFAGDLPVAWAVTMVIVALLGGFGMGTNIDWYTEAQRIQSARSVRDAAYSIWLGSALVIAIQAIWAATVIAFYADHPNLTNLADQEMAWYRAGFDNFPSGMLGFFFAAIVAIHFSTISSQLNLGSVYITRDLYQRYIHPQASARRLMRVGQISTFVLLLGSFLYSTMMTNVTQWLIFALWIMAAGLWLPNILQVVWWRFNSWGFLIAWMANLGLSWLVVWILPYYGLIPVLPDYLQFWTLMILQAMIFIPVTLLTPPENMDHLVRFYVQSRPLGWWGPVRREALRRGLIQGTPP